MAGLYRAKRPAGGYGGGSRRSAQRTGGTGRRATVDDAFLN